MTTTAHNPDQRVPCGVPGCGVTFPIREMASLTDKNDHGWYICPDCIDGMWSRKPWTPPADYANHPDVILRSAQKLPELIGSLSVLVDMIQTTDAGNAAIIRRVFEALDTARKAYTESDV